MSQESKNKEEDNTPSISVSQETNECADTYNAGLLIVTLRRTMRYATGTGKFYPRLLRVPDFDVELISSPSNDSDNIGLSFGCGTIKDFNVHIKAKSGELAAGDYVFKYIAMDSAGD